MVGDQVNGVPHFFGAEPATVLEGPHAGLRALPREEDLARELILALQEDQRRMARIAVRAPADIASRWDPVAALPEQPRGVPYARLDRLQRELFVSLLRQYVDRAASAVANQAWTDITDAGLDQVCFGWAGPVERGAGHYALSGRACSSSTTTPRTRPITSTPCGATCAATSPGTCWPSTTRACATERSACERHLNAELVIIEGNSGRLKLALALQPLLVPTARFEDGVSTVVSWLRPPKGQKHAWKSDRIER